MLIQGKLLTHRPMATFMEPRETPVVLQICGESRYEYFYRENDDANQVTTWSHNLYGQYFQDMNGKMVYFSFEVDELGLMNFSESSLITIRLIIFLFFFEDPSAFPQG